MEPITSTANPLIKSVRALRQRKARVESGCFLVEGISLVGQAIEAGWTVENLLHAPDLLTSAFARELLTDASRRGIRVVPVSAPVMKSLAEKDNPQGILAVVRKREVRLDSIAPFARAAALVSPQDPGNVGTVLRTLDAVGAGALFLLDGGVEPYHPAVVRASMGALFWVPAVEASFEAFLSWARARDCRLIGTSARGEVDFRTLMPREPWVLVLGSEQKGLGPEHTAACDVTVALPMRGRVSSLNLAVAAGVLLYQFCR